MCNVHFGAVAVNARKYSNRQQGAQSGPFSHLFLKLQLNQIADAENCNLGGSERHKEDVVELSGLPCHKNGKLIKVI